MNFLSERVTVDENICNGKPSIRGTRIPVQTILEFLSSGNTTEEILAQFPALDMDDIKASLRFAASLMDRNFKIKSVV
jgi:uncharacterized protein (DUF433 family)